MAEQKATIDKHPLFDTLIALEQASELLAPKQSMSGEAGRTIGPESSLKAYRLIEQAAKSLAAAIFEAGGPTL